MMATGKQVLTDGPEEIEALLPWHAAGTLSVSDARRVEDALARDPVLAKQFAVIRGEYAETIALNESLGAPSARAMQKLFEAIDAEPPREVSSARAFPSAFVRFFGSLAPRTLAAGAAAAAVLLLVQAGVIGTMLTKQKGSDTFETAASRPAAIAPATLALIRFTPEARADEITRFLENYAASIVGGPRSGLFSVSFGGPALSKNQEADLLKRVQAEKIVAFAAAE